MLKEVFRCASRRRCGGGEERSTHGLGAAAAEGRRGEATKFICGGFGV